MGLVKAWLDSRILEKWSGWDFNFLPTKRMSPTNFFDGQTVITKENYADAMAQAIGIEIATIPVYLYTYYSINRVPNQNVIMQDLQARFMARKHDPMTWEEARDAAQKWSARVMVFANKAGASIVSVAVEEMLHMSLSANVHQATIGTPVFVGQAPTSWPAFLPGHNPPFPINRAGLSLDQLYTFMQIESPRKFDLPQASQKRRKPIGYDTIGDFYQGIIDYLDRNQATIKYDTTRPQLAPNNGYYAQNNINTNYYDKEHKPNFTNAEDSGDLVFVHDFCSAKCALDIIREQGEGAQGATGFDENSQPVCVPVTDADYDDKLKKELAHFDKFNKIWCLLQDFEESMKEMVQDSDFDVKQYFVYNVPKNPSTSQYPPNIQAVSNVLNAVYAYVFLMSQSCYNVDKPVQYEIFMAGIHKTMMWILGSLCETIVTMTYVDKDGVTRNAAPTFEEYAFNAASSPKSQIQALCQTMLEMNPTMHTNACKRIDSLPNIPLNAEPNSSTTIFA